MAAVATYEIPKIFTLNAALKPSRIPKDDVLIKHAQEILEASVSWKEGKTYQNVKTFTWEQRPKAKNAQRWYCMVMRIHKKDLAFNKMWSKIGRNQVWHQKSNQKSIIKANRIQYISEAHAIWNILVTMPPPLSPRTYTIFQASSLLEYSHNRRGIVVTLPINLSSGSTQQLAEVEEKGTRGRYASIEHLQEMDGDYFEWRKVTCKDPGGSVPGFWARRDTAHVMAEENAAFLDWILGTDEDDGHDSEEEIGAG